MRQRYSSGALLVDHCDVNVFHMIRNGEAKRVLQGLGAKKVKRIYIQNVAEVVAAAPNSGD